MLNRCLTDGRCCIPNPIKNSLGINTILFYFPKNTYPELDKQKTTMKHELTLQKIF